MTPSESQQRQHGTAHQSALAADRASSPDNRLTERVTTLVEALRRTTSALRGSEAQRVQLKAEITALAAKLEESKQALAEQEEAGQRIAESHDRLAEHLRSAASGRKVFQLPEQLSVKDTIPPDAELYYRQQTEIERQEIVIAGQRADISTLHQWLAEKDRYLRDVLESVSWRLTAPIRKLTDAFRAKPQIPVASEKKFDETLLLLIRDCGIFDARYYLAEYPDIALASIDPAEHYLTSGGFEGRKPHALFDSTFYLTTYRDVAENGANPLVHFLLFGAKQGYNPHPLFLCTFYRDSNPDVAASGANELAHYIRHGAWEGRDPNPFLNSEYYLEQHPNLTVEKITPLQHYIETGWREGANPHPLFWGNYYIEANADVTQTAQPPLIHFLNFGNVEGRDPNPLLHGRWYLETYPDANRAAEGPLKHFLTIGVIELLDPSPLFSTTEYLAIHPHVLSSGISALEDVLERARIEFSTLPKPWPSPLRVWWRDIWIARALDSATIAPEVSVIIPCFNQGNFLEDAILSALISKVSTEVIVIDDGSTDPLTVQEIDRLQRLYPIRVVRRANGGLAAARNSGLEIARGAYIQFLDCDDVIFPEKLSKQTSHLKSQSQLGISVCEYYLSNVYLSSWYKARPSTLHEFTFDHASFLKFWERGLSIPIHCALFKRETLSTIRFNEAVRAKEDWLFWLDISEHGACIELLNETLAIYRQHGQNMSRDAANMGQEFLHAVTHICRSENSADFLENALEHYQEHYVPMIQAQAKKLAGTRLPCA